MKRLCGDHPPGPIAYFIADSRGHTWVVPNPKPEPYVPVVPQLSARERLLQIAREAIGEQLSLFDDEAS